jgi:hypothetical protein
MSFRVSGCVRWGALLAGAALLAFGSSAHAQRQVADSNSGYIDSALIGNVARFRFDAGYDDNVPDRAEFFYGKCGCFRVLGADPRAPGPPKLEKGVDYQDLSGYLEYAVTDRLSGFVELPYRFLNPEVNANASGLADMNAGFKWAFISTDDWVMTFQFKTYAPTGDAERGLGNNHVSLEPGLLFWGRLTDKLIMEGEFRPWFPAGGTDFEGNILRYGLGFSYDLYHIGCARVVPVVEFVGWTILSGMQLPIPPQIELTPQGFAYDIIPAQPADGETIVNVKLGVRAYFAERSSLYVGYGRALTGTVWYKDMLRVEYRLAF